MRQLRDFVVKSLVGGLLVVVPIYLALLLLLKAMQSIAGMVRPAARLLPDWLPAEQTLSLLLVLIVCFIIGVAVQAPPGQAVQEQIERVLFRRLPGYALVRGLTHQLAGDSHEVAWKPALAEIEEALVPAFIIEHVGDGHVTVFVPSAPNPLAGSVYILGLARVHPLNATVTQTVKTLSKWGLGSKDLVAAMEKTVPPPAAPAASNGS